MDSFTITEILFSTLFSEIYTQGAGAEVSVAIGHGKGAIKWVFFHADKEALQPYVLC